MDKEARQALSYFQQSNATTCSAPTVLFAKSVDVDRVVSTGDRVSWLVRLVALAYEHMAMLIPSSNRGMIEPEEGIFYLCVGLNNFCDYMIRRQRSAARERDRMALARLKAYQKDMDVHDIMWMEFDLAPLLHEVCMHAFRVVKCCEYKEILDISWRIGWMPGLDVCRVILVCDGLEERLFWTD